MAVCRHKDLPIAAYHLFYETPFSELAQQVMADIRYVSPDTKVVAHMISLDDPWDFEEVYGVLYDFIKKYRFYPGKEEYLIHLTTGTHTIQICFFLLAESYHLPGKLIQTIPPKKEGGAGPGTYAIIDLNLSRYNQIAKRFNNEIKDDTSLLKSGIQTRNASFNRMVERIEKIAVLSKDPILLTGPTGTGKSLLAHRIVNTYRR